MNTALIGFRDGDTNIKAVYVDDDYFRVGEGGTTKIVVVMENGQMAGVPWFAVFAGDKLRGKFNAALVNSVEYID